MTGTLSDIEVVRYSPELKEQIIAFWDRPRRYFEWKYDENPYFREPVFFVAVDGEGTVVGTRGFCGSRWHTPEEAVVIPCADDFAIAEQHRNTGLATAIMRTALDDLEHRGYPYVMSASAGEITVLQSLAMGWKSIGGMEPVAHLARRTPVARVSRAVRSRLRRGRSTPFERLDRAGGRPSATSGGTIVVESLPRPAAMAELADRLPFAGRIRHMRDSAYFEWRFRDPRQEYRFLWYERDGRTDGYLVIVRRGAAARRGAAPPTTRFDISDWEGTSHEIRDELLELAVTWGGFEVLTAWTGCLAEKSKAALARSGFETWAHNLRARGMPCVLLKRLGLPGDWSIGGVSAVDRSHWDIRFLDSLR